MEAANVFLEVAPVAIMDDVYNCAHSYLCDGIDALELALNKEVADHARVTSLVESVHQQVVQRLDKNLDKLELYTLANILTISEDLCPDLKDLNQIEVGPSSADLRRDEAGADRRRRTLLSQMRMARRLNQHLNKELDLFERERPRMTELVDASDRFVHDISLVHDVTVHVDLKVRDHRDRVRALQADLDRHQLSEPESRDLVPDQIHLNSLSKFAQYCPAQDP